MPAHQGIWKEISRLYLWTGNCRITGITQWKRDCSIHQFLLYRPAALVCGKGNQEFIKIREKMCIRDRNVKDSHVVEVAAINGFEVSGCTFSDQTASNEKKEALLANEVIQLDLLVQGHFSGYKYEALDMKNVVISNNIFNHVLRGVGSHTAYSLSLIHILMKFLQCMKIC